MIHKATTLILGAGASCHLGYPLGSILRNDILGIVDPQKKNTEMNERYPDMANLSLRESFYNKLSRGGWGSPDAFLEHHPEYLEFGKQLIAFCLKSHEDSSRLFPPQNNGWYDYLGQCLLGTSPSVNSFRTNRLSIITYNYDRSVEHYLHELVRFRLNLEPAEAWELVRTTVPIVHVHGILGEYPSVPYEASRDVSHVVSGIKIISEIQEKADGFCSSEFQRANQLLNESEAIYSIGFAMAHANVQRLRFFTADSVQRRTVKCAVGHIHQRQHRDLCHQIQKFGFGSEQILAADSNTLFTYHVGLE